MTPARLRKLAAELASLKLVDAPSEPAIKLAVAVVRGAKALAAELERADREGAAALGRQR